MELIFQHHDNSAIGEAPKAGSTPAEKTLDDVSNPFYFMALQLSRPLISPSHMFDVRSAPSWEC